MKNFMQAGKFKAECLKILQEVNSTGKEIIITKRGVPIAKLCPISTEKKSLFGMMKGTMTLKDDIIGPIEETWDADS